jgi:hypothetical protein
MEKLDKWAVTNGINVQNNTSSQTDVMA